MSSPEPKLVLPALYMVWDSAAARRSAAVPPGFEVIAVSDIAITVSGVGR